MAITERRASRKLPAPWRRWISRHRPDHHRRDRRLAALGGRPLLGPDRDVLAEAEEYAPRRIDEKSYVEQIQELATGLAGAVDEATGHSLDNLVNTWADMWTADAIAQYAAYEVRARYRYAERRAAVLQYELMKAYDADDLAEAELVRRTTRLRLLGLGRTDDPGERRDGR